MSDHYYSYRFLKRQPVEMKYNYDGITTNNINFNYRANKDGLLNDPPRRSSFKSLRFGDFTFSFK